MTHTPAGQSLACKLISLAALTKEIFRLDFAWPGPAPGAGQFFMIKPLRSSVFLGRPISAALWESGVVRFLVTPRGRGTKELLDMRIEEEAELTGPLGNCWADFLPAARNNMASASKQAGGSPEKSGGPPIALVGGGIGIAPLGAFAAELCAGAASGGAAALSVPFDFYAGFKTGFGRSGESSGLPGLRLPKGKLLVATEDGSAGRKGLIPDFLDPADYSGVYACGPEPMLKAVALRCKKAEVPCFVSMERRMACGVGACLGCTVKTPGGSRRCCAEGPIFRAEEICFDD
jgi:NAD(P)H-flavin reductase